MLDLARYGWASILKINLDLITATSLSWRMVKTQVIESQYVRSRFEGICWSEKLFRKVRRFMNIRACERLARNLAQVNRIGDIYPADRLPPLHDLSSEHSKSAIISNCLKPDLDLQT